MPRTVEQNDKIKLERSNDILAAALKLFSVVGYDNVSVDLITDTVSCSHGLFYHYFTSVDDIFVKVLESASKFDFEPINLKAVAEADGSEGLFELASYFGSEKSLNEAFLCFAKIYLQESDNEIFQNWLNNYCGFKTVDDLLISLINKGQADKKVIEGDPEEIAACIKKFALAYINDIASSKKKSRKPISASTFISFISR